MLVPEGLYSFPDGFTATWRTRSPFLKFFVVGRHRPGPQTGP